VTRALRETEAVPGDTKSGRMGRSWAAWTRSGRDTTLGLGLLSCGAGIFFPWVWQLSYFSWSHPRNVFLERVFRETTRRLFLHPHYPRSTPEEWWWCLPMIYGLAIPVMWCWSARDVLGARLCAAWLWWLGILGTMASIMLVPALRTMEERPWHLDSGFALSAVGAAMIALPSMLDLHRRRRRNARWARRPGASCAREANPGEPPRPIPAMLRDLVHDASMLWAELGPHEPLEPEQSRVLVELVGGLRHLGPAERSWLTERGASPEALVETLAPSPSDRESWLDENLRLDRGLAHLVTATRRQPVASPYR